MKLISTAPWAHSRVLAWEAGTDDTHQTEAELHLGPRASMVSGAPVREKVKRSICRYDLGLSVRAPEGGHGPGSWQTVPYPEGDDTRPSVSGYPLWAGFFQQFRGLPFLSHPPCSPGWAEGEDRAGLLGMTRNKMPLSPNNRSLKMVMGWRNWHQCQSRLWDPTGA